MDLYLYGVSWLTILSVWLMPLLKLVRKLELHTYFEFPRKVYWYIPLRIKIVLYKNDLWRPYQIPSVSNICHQTIGPHSCGDEDYFRNDFGSEAKTDYEAKKQRLEEKQGRVLKHPQLSCTGGNSGWGVERRMGRAPKVHLGPHACKGF